MSRLKKVAAELLNETEITKTFTEDLNGCLKGIDNLCEDITSARMMLNTIKRDYYFEAPQKIDNYLSGLFDKLEDSHSEIEGYKEKLQNGQIKFINNH